MLFLVPFMLPSFIGALAWKMLLSPRAGYINTLLMTSSASAGRSSTSTASPASSPWRRMYLFPFVFIQVCGALERMDPTLEESARISGAGLFTITRKITLPLDAAEHPLGRAAGRALLHGPFRRLAVLGTETGIFNIPTLIYEKISPERGQVRGDPDRDDARRPSWSSRPRSSWPSRTGSSRRALPDHRRQELAAACEIKLRGLRVPLLVPVHRLHRLHRSCCRGHDLPRGRLKTYGLPFTAGEHDAAQLHVHPLRHGS